ncbi:MAG TPA: hypothetical protein VFT37_10230 [Telluria sp.]|nr:hypothetical protein [Telluria sp.]
MREKDAARMYMRELWGSIFLYALILVLAIRFGRAMPEGALRTAILLSPMVGFGLAIWAMVRQFGRMDEYIRRVQLENLGIATAITAGLSFTYGFLETAGFPKLSMFWVWIVLGASLLATNLLRAYLKR